MSNGSDEFVRKIERREKGREETSRAWRENGTQRWIKEMTALFAKIRANLPILVESCQEQLCLIVWQKTTRKRFSASTETFRWTGWWLAADIGKLHNFYLLHNGQFLLSRIDAGGNILTATVISDAEMLIWLNMGYKAPEYMDDRIMMLLTHAGLSVPAEIEAIKKTYLVDERGVRAHFPDARHAFY